MNLSSLPHWLSPGWLLTYAATFCAFALLGRIFTQKRERERREAACRAAERAWPKSQGVIESCPRGDDRTATVRVHRGPQRGLYPAEVPRDLQIGLAVGKEVVCRVGRHPGDRVEHPLRCVIEQIL